MPGLVRPVLKILRSLGLPHPASGRKPDFGCYWNELIINAGACQVAEMPYINVKVKFAHEWTVKLTDTFWNNPELSQTDCYSELLPKPPFINAVAVIIVSYF